MMIDWTKPIEPLVAKWKNPQVLKVLSDNEAVVLYDLIRDNTFEPAVGIFPQENGYFRNVRTLAERCREELKGATEVRVWGEDILEQGIVCKSYINNLGIRNVFCGVFYDNEYGTHSDGQFDCNYSAYITPAHWTPEEAAQLAEELGL